MRLAQTDETLHENSHTPGGDPWEFCEPEKDCVSFANHLLEEFVFVCLLRDVLEVIRGDVDFKLKLKSISEEPLQH
jgi:hypothetical protein